MSTLPARPRAPARLFDRVRARGQALLPAATLLAIALVETAGRRWG